MLATPVRPCSLLWKLTDLIIYSYIIDIHISRAQSTVAMTDMFTHYLFFMQKKLALYGLNI